MIQRNFRRLLGSTSKRLHHNPRDFDLLHFGGWDISGLALIERKTLLEPLIANKPGLQYNGHDTGDGELILKHAGKLRAFLEIKEPAWREKLIQLAEDLAKASSDCLGTAEVEESHKRAFHGFDVLANTR